jgi:hypothetical protein
MVGMRSWEGPVLRTEYRILGGQRGGERDSYGEWEGLGSFKS